MPILASKIQKLILRCSMGLYVFALRGISFNLVNYVVTGVPKGNHGPNLSHANSMV